MGFLQSEEEPRHWVAVTQRVYFQIAEFKADEFRYCPGWESCALNGVYPHLLSSSSGWSRERSVLATPRDQAISVR